MRTREEIENNSQNSMGDRDSDWRAVEGIDLLLEVLLDIRDLLQVPEYAKERRWVRDYRE